MWRLPVAAAGLKLACHKPKETAGPAPRVGRMRAPPPAPPTHTHSCTHPSSARGLEAALDRLLGRIRQTMFKSIAAESSTAWARGW